MITGNPYASQSTDLLERRSSEAADGPSAELAYVFTPDGFRWLRGQQERVNSVNARDEMQSPMREVMVMEL
jgi:hypothetical protein